MNHLLYPVLAAVAWAGLAVKLRDLRRGPNPARYAVCGALALLGSTFTVSTPAVWSWLDRSTGVANLAALWAHLSVVGFSATVQLLVLWWVNPTDLARRRTRVRLAFLAVAAAAMVVLFLAGGPTEPHATDFVATYAHRPYIAAYLLVYLASFAVGLADVVRMCWPYARVAGRSWLRRGLRTAAAGSVIGLVYCALRVAGVIGARAGADIRRWEWITPIAASLGALLVILGLTMPAWGPRLSQAFGWLRRRRQYRLLAPLWSDLHRLMPQIALEPTVAAPLSTLDRRLYRRVIELYDGSLALRPYLDEAAAGRAERMGARLGLRPDELAAVMEAARLRGAVRAYAEGEPAPHGGPVTESKPPHGGSVTESERARHGEPVTESERARHGERVGEGADEATPARPDEGTDLSAEVARLVRVSRAYAGSPVVAAAVAGREALPAEATEVAM